jgi:hypothetical protein
MGDSTPMIENIRVIAAQGRRPSATLVLSLRRQWPIGENQVGKRLPMIGKRRRQSINYSSKSKLRDARRLMHVVISEEYASR